MTKAEIIDAVHASLGAKAGGKFSRKEASELVDSVFDEIKKRLCAGEKVKIARFGNFVTQHKRERVGRNPQTNTPLIISARRVARFRPSDALDQLLNPKVQP